MHLTLPCFSGHGRRRRWILSTPVASAYAELFGLFAVRDTADAALAIRTKKVGVFRQRHQFPLEILASVRQVEARQAAAPGQLPAIDERIAVQKNGIATRLGAGPIGGLAITDENVLGIYRTRHYRLLGTTMSQKLVTNTRCGRGSNHAYM